MSELTDEFVIRALTDEEAASYLEFLYDLYSKQAVDGFILPKEDAYRIAKDILDSLLPQGHKTENNYFYGIKNKNNEIVGNIWLAVEKEFGKTIAFLRYIHVDNEHQRKGYASDAIKDLEIIVNNDFKIQRLQLNVFGFNKGAIKLYDNLGYTAQRTTMIKDLS